MFNYFAAVILAGFLYSTSWNFFFQSFSGQLPMMIQESGPQKIVSQSLGIKTTAKSILVIDDESQNILFSKDPDRPLPIASISKLMTALVFLDQTVDWEQKVLVTKDDQKEGGMVRVFPGEEVTAKDLFSLTLVASANEAAQALSRISNQEDFVKAMNNKARDLGLQQTEFFEVTGLSEKNVSTVKDLVRLSQAAFARPEIAQAVLLSEYQFNVINNRRQATVPSTDKLLSSFLHDDDYQIIGAKTGHLTEAGYCLVLQIKNLKIKKSVTLAILGSETETDRWQEAKGLVDWVYKNYDWTPGLKD